MFKSRSFKFFDDSLNRELVSLLKRAQIDHSIGEDGVVHYSAGDQDIVENDLICSIRDKAIPSWQVLTCPGDWIDRYREYMIHRDISFREELSDGELWFLISRKYRPYSWKLDVPVPKKRLAKSQG